MMMRPQKWCHIMSTLTLVLSKTNVPVRIIGIITVRQAFETMMKIIINLMGKLKVMAVLEIVSRQLPCQYHIGPGTSIIKM